MRLKGCTVALLCYAGAARNAEPDKESGVGFRLQDLGVRQLIPALGPPKTALLPP